MIATKTISPRLAEILNADMDRDDKLSEIVGEFINDAEIRALSPRQVEAIALTRGNLTHAQAAQIMGVAKSTFNKHVIAARAKTKRIDVREATP